MDVLEHVTLILCLLFVDHIGRWCSLEDDDTFQPTGVSILSFFKHSFFVKVGLGHSP
jgi:hypothetical protein